MTAKIADLYESLSGILLYPEEGFVERVDQCCQILEQTYTHELEHLIPFREAVHADSLEKWQERYIQTFDVQAVCCLDVGYSLFGEDYKRGQFMAELKTLQNQHHVDCGVEMPDFLPNILKLLTKIDYDTASQICTVIVIPGIEKMFKSFAENSNPYQKPIQVILNVLNKDFFVKKGA